MWCSAHVNATWFQSRHLAAICPCSARSSPCCYIPRHFIVSFHARKSRDYMARASALIAALYLLSTLGTASCSQDSCKLGKVDERDGAHPQQRFSTVSVAAIQKFTDVWKKLAESVLELPKSHELSTHHLAPLNALLVTVEPAAASIHGLIDSGYLVRS